MTRTRWYILSLFILTIGLAACDQGPTTGGTPTPDPTPTPTEPKSIIAFVDVAVIPMTDTEILGHQTVIIHDDEIAAIGPTAQVQIPANATRIDGTGKFLVPGLTDMHTHITVGTPEVAEQQGILFLAHGVTTILNMGDINRFDINAIKKRWRDGDIPGPTMYTGKFARGAADGGASAGLVVNAPGEARPFAIAAKQAGYDFLKIYNWINADVFAALVTAGDDVGMPAIGHVPVPMGTVSATLAGGMKMIAHSGEYYWQHYQEATEDPNGTRTQFAINATKTHRAYITATLCASESVTMLWGGNTEGLNELLKRPSAAYAAESVQTHWQGWLNNWAPTDEFKDVDTDPVYHFIKQYTKDFHDGGVQFLLGTDAPDVPGLLSGFATYEEIRLLHEIGLTPLDILRIASRNAGNFITEVLPNAQGFGTIEAGKRADLLLLNANPLDDINHLHQRTGVMARGRWYTETELQNLMAALRQ